MFDPLRVVLPAGADKCAMVQQFLPDYPTKCGDWPWWGVPGYIDFIHQSQRCAPSSQTWSQWPMADRTVVIDPTLSTHYTLSSAAARNERDPRKKIELESQSPAKWPFYQKWVGFGGEDGGWGIVRRNPTSKQVYVEFEMGTVHRKDCDCQNEQGIDLPFCYMEDEAGVAAECMSGCHRVSGKEISAAGWCKPGPTTSSVRLTVQCRPSPGCARNQM